MMQALFQVGCACIQMPPGHFIFLHLAMYCYTVATYVYLILLYYTPGVYRWQRSMKLM